MQGKSGWQGPKLPPLALLATAVIFVAIIVRSCDSCALIFVFVFVSTPSTVLLGGRRTQYIHHAVLSILVAIPMLARRTSAARAGGTHCRQHRL
jgi:hypothetical protein